MNDPIKSLESMQLPREPSSSPACGQQREPLFGPGAAPFLAELIIAVGALGLLLLALLLAGVVKERAYSVLFGEPPHAHTSNSSTSLQRDGYKVRRVD